MIGLKKIRKKPFKHNQNFISGHEISKWEKMPSEIPNKKGSGIKSNKR